MPTQLHRSECRPSRSELEGFGVLGEVIGNYIPVGFRIHPDMRLGAEARVVVEAAHGNHNPAPARIGGGEGAAAVRAERVGETFRIGDSIGTDVLVTRHVAERFEGHERVRGER